MPVHTVVGSDAPSLVGLVDAVEASGETVIAVLPAGNCWAVVTRPPVQVAVKSQPRKPIAR